MRASVDQRFVFGNHRIKPSAGAMRRTHLARASRYLSRSEDLFLRPPHYSCRSKGILCLWIAIELKCTSARECTRAAGTQCPQVLVQSDLNHTRSTPSLFRHTYRAKADSRIHQHRALSLHLGQALLHHPNPSLHWKPKKISVLRPGARPSARCRIEKIGVFLLQLAWLQPRRQQNRRSVPCRQWSRVSGCGRGK